MTSNTSTSPVIIGLGFHQEKSDKPEECSEALKMMEIAIESASKDCGHKDISKDFDSITVLRGSWQYPNPGLLLKERFSCPDAKIVMSEIGVLQMMPIFQLCDAISKGEQELGVVLGAEARFRDLRSLITGTAVENTEQKEETPEPDVFFRNPDAFSSDLEAERGLWAPADFFAIADSAIRYSRGQSIEERRQELAQMYSHFSEVAANNPHAWSQVKYSEEDFLSLENKNPMVTFPFTKRMISQWNVNQSVAIIICSYDKALSLNIDEDKMIFPMAYAQSRHMVNLAQKETLHSHTGLVTAGDKLFSSTGLSPEDVDLADLYSCFPASITAGKQDLNLPEQCPVSLTGTMALAGGPYNHAAVDSIARVAEVMRERKVSKVANNKPVVGLSTNISGMFGKQAVSLLSTELPENEFKFIDVTDDVAKIERTIEIDDHYEGEAEVVAYAVMYDKAEVSHAVAYCQTPEGKRSVGLTKNKILAEEMTRIEYVGKNIRLELNGEFSPV